LENTQHHEFGKFFSRLKEDIILISESHVKLLMRFVLTDLKPSKSQLNWRKSSLDFVRTLWPEEKLFLQTLVPQTNPLRSQYKILTMFRRRLQKATGAGKRVEPKRSSTRIDSR
jgi:hypothetical protein